MSQSPLALEPIRPQPIKNDEIYRRDDFLARVGWGIHAWRSAKRTGLKVIRTAGRCYVRGCDFNDYLDHIAMKEME